MKKINIIFKCLIFTFIIGLISLIGLYCYAALCPKLELKTANGILLYDNSGKLFDLGSASNEWTKLDNININLINSTISIEDKNFYKHQGFDFLRIIKALYINFKSNKIKQGASTISQQYVKNLYLDFKQSWKRKINEAFLTMQLEVNYSKDDILEGYLNTINYGQGNYGITNAAKYYFNKKPNELSLEECILLSGIPKNPNNYNPVSNLELALKRAKIVAKSLLKNKYITKDEYNKLNFNNIKLNITKTKSNSDMILYYKDAVIEELNTIDSIPKSLIDSGGLKIYTSLDSEIQNYLEENINNELKNDNDIQIASIIVNPNNGEVLALSGGRNYAKSQYNRVTMAKRQVGSTMKPFLYYAALENNFVSSSTFTSEETIFNFSNGTTYNPTNYGSVYANKPITMAAALALSDNIYAVKTNIYLGSDTMVEVAHRTGIKGNLLSVPSLALGTSEINMLDYARGYSTFASGGYKNNIHFIKKIEDLDGNVLYEVKNEENLVLNPNYTYILNEMMTNTTNANFIDYTKPSALVIKDKLTNKYAIKTGSTGTDFYLAGYTPDFLMLVWTGYDDSKDLELNKNIYTKYIFANSVEHYYKNHDYKWYDKPKNVIAIAKNAITGEDANTTSNSAIFYYVKGTEEYVFKEE